MHLVVLVKAITIQSPTLWRSFCVSVREEMHFRVFCDLGSSALLGLVTALLPCALWSQQAQFPEQPF